MPSGGYSKKDQELINKGYTTVNEMAKEFGRNRASIVTVLKYLGIKSTEIIGKHLFYLISTLQMYNLFTYLPNIFLLFIEIFY